MIISFLHNLNNCFHPQIVINDPSWYGLSVSMLSILFHSINYQEYRSNNNKYTIGNIIDFINRIRSQI